MPDFPIDVRLVQDLIQRHGIRHVGAASIREIVSLVNDLEEESGCRFLRMELGIPGLEAAEAAIRGEREALERGVASRYPPVRGVRELRHAAADFIRAYLGIQVEPHCVVATTGSTNASFLGFLVASRRRRNRDTTLFLDPGFPVHKLQLQVLGFRQQSLDVYEYRGRALGRKLEKIFSRGNVSTLLYSNPNNPTWMCLDEEELQIIGELATKYDVVVMEDLAYLTMDFRQDTSVPGEPPFQPTVARYTDNYLLLISSSKLFSLAGERVGVLVLSSALYDSRSQDLLPCFNSDVFGHCLVYGAAYAVSAGVSHSAQYGLAAVLRGAAEGREPMIRQVRVYGERAAAMKKIFQDNGFRIVYARDGERPLGDGFYFTLSYPGASGDQLVAHLLQFGIGAISLARTGSVCPEGIRACVSQISESDMPELRRRLELFHEHFSKVERQEA